MNSKKMYITLLTVMIFCCAAFCNCSAFEESDIAIEFPGVKQKGAPVTKYCEAQESIPASECQALKEIYDAFDNSSEGLQDWFTDMHPENWYGLTVENGHVTSFDSFYEDLGGTISPAFGDLPELTDLFLLESGLEGELPPELGKLSKLTLLFATDNHLRGEIPPELGNMSSLEILLLYGNDFSGALPSELASLPLYRFLLEDMDLCSDDPALHKWFSEIPETSPDELPYCMGAPDTGANDA